MKIGPGSEVIVKAAWRVVLAVGEDVDNRHLVTEVSLTPSQAREVARMLLRNANVIEARGDWRRTHVAPTAAAFE